MSRWRAGVRAQDGPCTPASWGRPGTGLAPPGCMRQVRDLPGWSAQTLALLGGPACVGEKSFVQPQPWFPQGSWPLRSTPLGCLFLPATALASLLVPSEDPGPSMQRLSKHVA